MTLLSLIGISIAYPYMDFQKSTDINMEIHDLWMSVFNNPHEGISMQGHSEKDIRKNEYP